MHTGAFVREFCRAIDAAEAHNRPAQMRHDAFMSYSHSDGTLARDIEKGLEKLAKPLLKVRALDVFRDETSLAASAGLWPSIVEHLSASEWFLLLSSVQSASSPWVAKEITWWLEHRSIDRMLVLLTDGEIVWDSKAGDFDRDRTTALSTVIHGKCADEPLYTDLRWAKGQGALDLTHVRFREAILSVAAPLRGVPKDELDGDDVRQMRRNRRFVRALVGAIAFAAVLAGWQWFEAATERNVARAQARVAASRQLVAQSRLPENALDVKLLLAAEAYQVAPTRDAHENLIRLFHDNDRFNSFLSGHDSPVSAAAFSDDGQWLATGEVQGRIVVWQLRLDGADQRFARSEVLLPPDGKTARVRDLKFTNTGALVAAYEDGVVMLFDVRHPGARPEVVARCLGWTNPQVFLNADASRIAVQIHNAGVSVWDRRTFGCSAPPLLRTPATSELALNRMFDRIAETDKNGHLTWWDLQGRSGSAAFSAGWYLLELASSPDGTKIAIIDSSTVRLRELTLDGHNDQILIEDSASFVTSTAFSAKGDLFATGLADGTVNLWRFGGPVPIRAQLIGHRHGFHVSALAFNDAGSVLASAGEDGIVMLWYLAGGVGKVPLSRELTGHGRPVQTIAFNHGNTLVSASGPRVIVWNAGISAFSSYPGRNEQNFSSYFNPTTKLTLSLPFIISDEDKNGCGLVKKAQSTSGDRLTAADRVALVGELPYVPTCATK